MASLCFTVKPPDMLTNSKNPLLDGKYVVLPSGELQIRNVGPDDGFKTYKCRTKHRLTGEMKLSATAGKLVITGKAIRRQFKIKGNFRGWDKKERH